MAKTGVRYISYFTWFWYKVAGLAVYIVRSRKQQEKLADHFLAEMEARFNGTFNAATRRKIAVSHGIYNPMICDAFARLHGRNTNAHEQLRLIHYFTCSSLFDDFTDYATISEAQMEAISFSPETYEAVSFDEQVFRYAHLYLYNLVTDKAAYSQVTRDLFRAQIQSKQQLSKDLTDEEIAQITFTKGGYSVLLCSYYLDVAATQQERDCWYTIGTLIQLTNDLFDIWKDLQEGVATLPVRMTNAYAFEEFFCSRIATMKAAIRALPFSEVRKKEFSLRMAGIYSFGLIALGQLKNIQGNAPSLPSFHTLPRKALIIDMEKPANLARWFKYTYRYGRL